MSALIILVVYLVVTILIIAILPRLIFSLVWSGGQKNPFLSVRLAYAGTLAILGILFPLSGFWPRFIAPITNNALPYGAWIVCGIAILLSLLLPVLGKKMPSREVVEDDDEG